MANRSLQLTVTGPSVVSGKTTLPVQARIRDDNTFDLCS